MDVRTKKVLVTGADGFIGSHLCAELVRRGHSVRAFVLYNSANSWGCLDRCSAEIKSAIEIVTGDVRDQISIMRAMQGCDAVFHLAALIAIPYSYESPSSYIETNVNGTLNVLQAANQLGISKIVHTSTSEVYGTPNMVPISESHPLRAQSPYAASKIAADQLALSFFCSYGTPVTVVRPFNTYGPRQSARAMIPAAIVQIASGQHSIKLGSLTPTRDFNYVVDTVNGFIAAAESDDALGEVINIGSNHEISIGDTVKMIAEIMRADVTVETDPDRLRPENSEVQRLKADNSKAKRLLKWEPLYGGDAGLRNGLAETIEWYANSEHLSDYKVGIYNK